MPMFTTPEEYVAYLVFKQTRTVGDVTTYEVVDRLAQPPAPRIVASFDTADEADALRNETRTQRVADIKSGRIVVH